MDKSDRAPIRIGLDIGIASVGWAVMACDEQGEPKRILGLGSRIFDSAEVQNGGSLAAERRDARSMRRRLRRKGERLRRLRQLLKEYDVEINFAGEDVNMLRLKGLDELLSDNDFARILYLLCKNRGFKSSKKDDKTSKEGLQSANSNRALMESKHYRTVGEMIYKEFVYGRGRYGGKWRNVSDDYSHTVYRDDLINELKLLFAKQRELGGKLASSDIEDKYFEIFSSQRSYDMGPGKGSKYSAEYAVGMCAFEQEERRAPKASFSYEWSRALEHLNNVAIKSEYGSRPLSAEERVKAMEAMRGADEFTYNDLRKLLSLGADDWFNLSYPRPDYEKFEKKLKEKKPDITDDEKVEAFEKYEREERKKFEGKQKLSSLKASNAIRAALDEAHRGNNELVDRLAEALSYSKSEQKRSETFAQEEFSNLSQDEKAKLVTLDADKFGNLSLKALRKILPYLEAGKKYSEACEAVYGSHTSSAQTQRAHLLNTNEVYEAVQDITSPVVKRSVSQTLKVLNAIIRKYGSPIAVNIELARDLSRPFDERKKMERQINDRYEENERIKKDIFNKFDGYIPRGEDIVKYRLYEEQGCKCIYSGTTIEPDRLFDGTSYQVDHVMPYSRSFNDSYNNKVLVLTAENQKKKDSLPYEYMSTEQFEAYEARVRAQYANNRAKRDILLRKKLDETEWKSSALNDTRYISVTVKNLIEQHLEFDPRGKGKLHVFTFNGKMTAYLRKRWGIEKVRSDGDLHHAVDAAVIACMTKGMEQKITDYSKRRELYRYVRAKNNVREVVDTETGEIVNDRLQMPYETFRKELILRTGDDIDEMRDKLSALGYTEADMADVSVANVSRMPRRKMKGKLHKKTLNSAKHLDEGIIVSKTPLNKLNLDSNGEIANYYDPEHNLALYNKLKGILAAAGGKGAKAFDGIEVHKSLKDGSDGPRVYGVKTFTNSTSGVLLDKNGAIAGNGEMCRVDVYSRNGKFYAVPVYVSDVYKGVLPMKAVVQGRNEDEWLPVSSDEFVFSLHKDDIVYIESKGDIPLNKAHKDPRSKLPDRMFTRKAYFYFNSLDRSGGSMKFESIDGCYECRIHIQNLLKFQKCEIDVLGEIHQVKAEKLMPLTPPRN